MADDEEKQPVPAPSAVAAVAAVAAVPAVRPKSCHVPPLREPPPPPSPSSSSLSPSPLAASAPSTPRRPLAVASSSSPLSASARRRPYRPPESADIVDTETIALTDKAPFTTYVIDVHVHGQESFRIRRRYNQFYFLHKKLKAEGFDAERPQLPPKRAIGHMTADFVAQRREQLQQYLSAVVRSEALCRSDGVSDFFDATMPASEMLTDPEREGAVMVFKHSRKRKAVEKMKAGRRSALFGSAWKSGWLVLKSNYVYLFRKPQQGAAPSKSKLTRKILGLAFCTVNVLDADRHIWELRSAIDERAAMVLRAKTHEDFDEWLFALRMSRLCKAEDTELGGAAAAAESGASFRKTAVRVAQGGIGFMRSAAPVANVPGGAIVRARSNATGSSSAVPEPKQENVSLRLYVEGTADRRARPQLERRTSAREIVYEPDTPETILYSQKRSGYIKAATVGKLFEKLFDTTWAIGYEYNEFMTAFMLTYRSFSSPEELLETLIRAFNDARAQQRHTSAPAGSAIPPQLSPTLAPASAPSSGPASIPLSPSLPLQEEPRSASVPQQEVALPSEPAPAASSEETKPSSEEKKTESKAEEKAATAVEEEKPQPELAPEEKTQKSVDAAPQVQPEEKAQPAETTPAVVEVVEAPAAATATPTVEPEHKADTTEESPQTEPTPPESPSRHPNIVQIRVCNILSKWIEVHFFDFIEDEVLTNRLLSFIDNVLPVSGMDSAAVKLKLMIWKQLEPSATDAEFLAAAPPPIIKEQDLAPGWAGAVFQLIDMSPVEVARQLCLIDFGLLKKIRPMECINQAWSRPGKDQRAPNILYFIARFNTLSRWTSSVVARTDQLRARAALLALLIEIAHQCLLLNNFNSALAICAGLETSAVYRLKKTWEQLPTTTISQYEKIKALMSRENNFHNIRELMHTIVPPYVPYLGTFLTDLTMVDEGNPDRLPNGMVNFEKNYLLSKVLNEILKCQQTPYCLLPVPGFQEYFSNLPVLPEEEVYTLSLKLEPPQARKDDAPAKV